MTRSAIAITSFLLLCGVTWGAEFEIGDSVIAYWKPSNGYFVGTAVEAKGGKYLVVFEDGDQGLVEPAKIRKNDIGPGTKVMARWTNGKFYGARVSKVVGRALYVQYDDGVRGWVPWSAIGLRQ